MAAFDTDFDWQRRFVPVITPILGAHLVREAPAVDDQKRNTDFMVLELGAVRVACRVRRWEQLARFPKYGDEFTIRAKRPSGQDTELAKVVSGWGNYIFYAFANQNDDDLAAWVLGDLNVFRLWHSRVLAMGKRQWVERSNHDGSSKFHVYTIADLPPEFVIARKRPPESTPVFDRTREDYDPWAGIEVARPPDWQED